MASIAFVCEMLKIGCKKVIETKVQFRFLDKHWSLFNAYQDLGELMPRFDVHAEQFYQKNVGLCNIEFFLHFTTRNFTVASLFSSVNVFSNKIPVIVPHLANNVPRGHFVTFRKPGRKSRRGYLPSQERACLREISPYLSWKFTKTILTPTTRTLKLFSTLLPIIPDPIQTQKICNSPLINLCLTYTLFFCLCGARWLYSYCHSFLYDASSWRLFYPTSSSECLALVLFPKFLWLEVFCDPALT